MNQLLKSSWIRSSIIVTTLFIGIIGGTLLLNQIKSDTLPLIPASQVAPTPTANAQPAPPERRPHVKTPSSVKAIYMTSWVSTVKPWRAQLLQFINESEINAIIIDIKDYSGYITFDTEDPVLASMNVEEIRSKDLKEFIEELHRNNIYVIARITVFQDPVYAKLFPSEAVQTRSGEIWKDRHGLHFIDPSSRKFWDYIIRISTAAEKVGFDELNFDYIRFPTDGNMKDMVFPISGPKLQRHSQSNTPNPVTSGNIATRIPAPKEAVITEFFKYLRAHTKPLGIPISADLFGMTMTAHDDVNIGQTLTGTAPYFDYICPMVYPSHYPVNFMGFSNPAMHPYEIIYHVMSVGSARMTAMGENPKKLRPWLQDFNLGAKYDAEKVRAQIKATYASGLDSWMIWDPRNKYTRGAYLKNSSPTESSPTGNAQ